MRASSVLCISGLGYESQLGQRIHNPSHGGRAHLLGGCQITQSYRPPEDNHGEGGQSRGIETALRVFSAQLPEQVNGRGMDFIGNYLRVL